MKPSANTARLRHMKHQAWRKRKQAANRHDKGASWVARMDMSAAKRKIREARKQVERAPVKIEQPGLLGAVKGWVKGRRKV